jgi:hypothetical protein
MSSVGSRDLGIDMETPELPSPPAGFTMYMMRRQQYLARRMLEMFVPIHNEVIIRSVDLGHLTQQQACKKFRHHNE